MSAEGTTDAGGSGTEPAGPGSDDGLEPGSVFAGLAVEAEVGRGGMGIVYRVRDPALDRTRALKVLSPDRSGEVAFRERFQRESRQAAAIEHPAVTTVFAAGEFENRLYLVMRLVNGPSLAELLASRGALALDETLAIARQIAGALDAAHATGLIHRDVKPGNVLLEGEAPEWRAFLCDFGISKLTGTASGLTSTGQFVGTVDYVAPEQIEGEDVDGRADVYSLACVIHHALGGKPPFCRNTQLATMFAHANAPRPALVAPDVPPAVGRALARAMSIRPEERHATAGELAAELDRLAGDASRDTTASLKRRTAARRPGRWLALAGVALLVALAAVPVAWLGGGDETAPVPAVEVARTIDIPRRPLAITTGPGRVWTASPATGAVTSIVPGADSAEQELPVGGQPAGVAVGLDWLWVVDRERDELLRIEPPTGRIDQRIPVGDEPVDVVVDDRSVWVACIADDSVWRIAPGTATDGDGREGDQPAAVADDIPVGDEPIALAAAQEEVWVVNRGFDAVSVIDGEGSRRDGNPIPVGQVPNDIAFGGGYIWVTDDFTGQVTPIDAATRQAGEPIAVGERPRGVAFGLGYLWVANGEDGTVTRIDPARREVVGEPVPVGVQPTDIAVGGNAVWTADFGDSTVTELRLAD